MKKKIQLKKKKIKMKKIILIKNIMTIIIIKQ